MGRCAGCSSSPRRWSSSTSPSTRRSRRCCRTTSTSSGSARRRRASSPPPTRPGTLLASLPAGLRRQPGCGPRRTVIGGLLLLGVSSVVFGFGHADRPARRRPLQPGDRRGADLVRRADLADHDRAARAPRLGDRHRAGHRRRRRPDRPGPWARWPRRSAPRPSSAPCSRSPSCSPCSPRALPESAPPERQPHRRGRGAISTRPVLDGDRLRRGPLADVRRGSRCWCRCGSTTSAAATR